MCIAFPGRVVSVDETGATVDLEGRLRRASTLLEPDVAAGEWVMIAAGTIVERLDEARAAEIRDALHHAIDLAEATAGHEGRADSTPLRTDLPGGHPVRPAADQVSRGGRE